jgi:hypothetical protein
MGNGKCMGEYVIMILSSYGFLNWLFFSDIVCGKKKHRYVDDSIISVVVRLQARQCWFQIPSEARDLPLLQNVQTGLGSYPASYSIDTITLSPGTEQPSHVADHSPPSSVNIKNEWRYTSTPPLHGMYMHSFDTCT